MNSNQIKLLNKMKKLITNGKCRFKIRRNRDTVSDITSLGISVEEAWNIISELNCNFYYFDARPVYGQSKNSLTFLRTINSQDVYIKLVLEEDEDGEVVVCWSFHS